MSTRVPVLLGVLLVTAVPALAQTTTPPAKPDAPPAAQPGLASPNAETPPGGIARGLVPAPRGVDPGMVTPPPGNTAHTMPVIPPPAAAR